MHIAYPSFLILASVVLLFWWFFFREKVGLPFPNRLMRRYARLDWRISLIWILRGLCITLVFLILANPTTSISQRIPLSAGNPIILTLDISKSMLADDIRPSRIERAKGVIDAFLAHESANQYGLVIFAGKAFTLSPLTTDRTGLRNIIENITTDTIRQYLP